MKGDVVHMSNGSFSFLIRTQFSFVVNDPTLSQILSGIAAQSINITGYLQTKHFKIKNKDHYNIVSNNNIVRLVVGSPDSETNADLIGVRKVLNSLGVKFQEKEVIQVLEVIPGVPGVINGIFGALWCKVTVNALYFGEETRLFIDVSDTKKALQILSQAPVKQCHEH
jgi:hypothetical protein